MQRKLDINPMPDKKGSERVTNFEALKQIPCSSFANMVFDVVKNKCDTLKDFEDFLNMDIKPDLEPVLKEALQNIQCFSTD